MSAEKKAVNQALSQLEAGMNDFCQMQSFTGKAADSVKAYLKEVHGPLIKGLMQAGDALQQEYKKMLDDFQHHVDNAPDAVIREEHLESVNSDLRSLQQQFESIYREMAADVQEAGDVADFAVPSPGQVSSEIENREHEVQQLKQKFSVFFAAAGQTGDAKALLSAVEQAMANIKKSSTA
ncbi:T7SS effector LXG polymorphic toxin [Terrilactibacillus sp. S3-3]|nr:T7SS effector LXG polymorphic toxin [Terrilactibacillus sp. S3-3]